MLGWFRRTPLRHEGYEDPVALYGHLLESLKVAVASEALLPVSKNLLKEKLLEAALMSKERDGMQAALSSYLSLSTFQKLSSAEMEAVAFYANLQAAQNLTPAELANASVNYLPVFQGLMGRVQTEQVVLSREIDAFTNQVGRLLMESNAGTPKRAGA